MKAYFQTLFEHEYWANLQVLETISSVKEPPQRVSEIFSHLVSAQTIWLDRINRQETKMKVWAATPDELFSSETCKELLEANHLRIVEILDKEEVNSTISYQNSKGEHFTSTIEQIFTHLALHASYHRGQVIILLKPFAEKLPATDFIFYVR